jgi:hypothetical protein
LIRGAELPSPVSLCPAVLDHVVTDEDVGATPTHRLGEDWR